MRRYLFILCFSFVFFLFPIDMDDNRVGMELLKSKNYYALEEDQEKYLNTDVIGRIKVDSIIDEPILQMSDSSSYIDPNKDEEKIKSLFLDYRVEPDFRKIVLYDTYNYSAFINYLDETFFLEHSKFEIDLFSKRKYYQVFSIFSDISDLKNIDTLIFNDLEWEHHLLEIKNNSIYSTNINISKKDSIVIIKSYYDNSCFFICLKEVSI